MGGSHYYQLASRQGGHHVIHLCWSSPVPFMDISRDFCGDE